MSAQDSDPFLYLTTTGRKSGKPHQIEIWFVAYAGCYYLVTEDPEQSDWVKNIRHNPAITLSVGSRDANVIAGTGRPLDRAQEPQLADAIAALMNAKYDWSEGLIVELKPNSG